MFVYSCCTDFMWLFYDTKDNFTISKFITLKAITVLNADFRLWINSLYSFGFGIWQHLPYNHTKGACEVNYNWISHLIDNQKCSGRKDIFCPRCAGFDLLLPFRENKCSFQALFLRGGKIQSHEWIPDKLLFEFEHLSWRHI